MASSSDQVHVVGQPKSVGKGAKAAYSLEGAAAHSGLPAVPPGATFTVLGIETSCDDTGAAVVRCLAAPCRH